MKTLAIIIPRYANSTEVSDTTNRCIELLIQHKELTRFNTKVTVVDDGSTIPFNLTRNGVRLIEHGSNKGIAVGWNTGWKDNPDADFLCWLNADVEVQPNWSFPLVVAAEQLECISMPYTEGKKAWRIGITGYCFLTTAKVANQIGPFDETFVPAWYEDVDWFHRAIQLNIPLLNVPSSNIKHPRGKGGTEFVPRKDLLHMANRLRFSWKHGTNPDVPPPMYSTPLLDVEIDDAH